MKAPVLFMAIQMVVASLIGWAGIVTVLVMDIGTLKNILICIGVSFVVAFPVAYVIVKRMTGN